MTSIDLITTAFIRDTNLELARAVQATRREIARRQAVRREARQMAIRMQFRIAIDRAMEKHESTNQA